MSDRINSNLRSRSAVVPVNDQSASLTSCSESFHSFLALPEVHASKTHGAARIAESAIDQQRDRLRQLGVSLQSDVVADGRGDQLPIQYLEIPSSGSKPAPPNRNRRHLQNIQNHNDPLAPDRIISPGIFPYNEQENSRESTPQVELNSAKNNYQNQHHHTDGLILPEQASDDAPIPPAQITDLNDEIQHAKISDRDHENSSSSNNNAKCTETAHRPRAEVNNSEDLNNTPSPPRLNLPSPSQTNSPNAQRSIVLEVEATLVEDQSTALPPNNRIIYDAVVLPSQYHPIEQTRQQYYAGLNNISQNTNSSIPWWRKYQTILAITVITVFILCAMSATIGALVASKNNNLDPNSGPKNENNGNKDEGLH